MSKCASSAAPARYARFFVTLIVPPSYWTEVTFKLITWPLSAHAYPQGTFSVIPSPHQEGHRGSLGPSFLSASLGIELTVRSAFGLALDGGFLTRLSRPLGALDIFLRACRPSETAHLSRSPCRLETQSQEGGVTLSPPPDPEAWLRRLPPTLCTRNRAPTTGCSKGPWGLRFPSGVPGMFAGKRVHRVAARDSRGLVDSFMQAAN